MIIPYGQMCSWHPTKKAVSGFIVHPGNEPAYICEECRLAIKAACDLAQKQRDEYHA